MMASSKLNPWRALRHISIRSRPSIQPVFAEQRRRILPAATASPLVQKRAYSDDTTAQPPSEPSGEYVSSGPEVFAPNFRNAAAISQLEQVVEGKDAVEDLEEGLLFDMPPRPKAHEKLQDRYDPMIHQVTRLLMRSGKLGVAQRRLETILNILRTSPAPKINPARPLLPDAPPASQLPLDPVAYLTLAIDSVAPLVRIHGLKGLGGGGRALDLPEPISVRVRRRVAVAWICEALAKKKGRGSGRDHFAHRFASEIIAIVEGRSPVWEKRTAVHKYATSIRANFNHPNADGKQKRFKS